MSGLEYNTDTLYAFAGPQHLFDLPRRNWQMSTRVNLHSIYRPNYFTRLHTLKIGLAFTVIGLIAALGLGLAALVADPYKLPCGVLVVFISVCFGFAAVQMSSDAPAKQLRDDLERSDYQSLYQATLERLLLWAFRKADIAEPQGEETVVNLFFNMLTHRLLDWSMRFAVIYPIVLLILPWALGGRAMSLGTTHFLTAPNPGWIGLISLVPLAIAPLAQQGIKRAAARPQRFKRTFAGWLERHEVVDVFSFTVAFAAALAIAGSVLLAFSGLDGLATAVTFVRAVALTTVGLVENPFAFAVTNDFTFEVAVALTIAGSLTIAVAFPVIFTGAEALSFALLIAVPLVGPVAVALAFAFLSAYEALHKGEKLNAASLLAIAFPVLAILITVFFADFSQINNFARAIFLFFGIAPIINAIFDMFSYAVTLALSVRGYRGHALFWGLLDAVIACALFLGLGAALVITISLIEKTSGANLLDLVGLLTQAGDFSRFWWLYAMLFSTALPTMLHLLIASLSLQSWAPQSWRSGLSTIIKTACEGDNRASIIAPLALGGIWITSIVLVFGAIFGLGYLLWGHLLEPFLSSYRDALLWVALQVGGI